MKIFTFEFKKEKPVIHSKDFYCREQSITNIEKNSIS